MTTTSSSSARIPTPTRVRDHSIFRFSPDGHWEPLAASAQLEVRSITTDRAGTYFALSAWHGFSLCTASTCNLIDKDRRARLTSLSIGAARLFAVYSDSQQVAPPRRSLYGYVLASHAPLESIEIPEELANDPPSVVELGPNDDTIAMGYPDGRVEVRDSAFHVLARFESHAAAVSALAWAPDGKRLASGHTDGTAFVWRR